MEGKGSAKKEREVAIKLLFEGLPQSAIDRSRREAAIRIKNDNLLEMIDFVEVNDTNAEGQVVATHYHVVSELLKGITLEEFLDGNTNNHDGSTNPLATRLLSEYSGNRKAFVGTVFRSILSGVQTLHDKGYIHRDIDPSNIMVTTDEKLKFIDFGIARQVNAIGSQDKLLTKTGQFVGKPYYAAPELITGDIVHQSYTTGIYALGIMLFQLVVGASAFRWPGARSVGETTA